MKLEMDLIRELLLWCEEHIPDKSRTYSTEEIDIPNYSHDQVIYHFAKLIEHGYLDAFDSSAGMRREYLLKELTWEGHDFLEGIRDNRKWTEFKKIAKSLGINVFKTALPVIAEILARQAGLIP